VLAIRTRKVSKSIQLKRLRLGIRETNAIKDKNVQLKSKESNSFGYKLTSTRGAIG
jgi:hypothetical protein